MTRSWTPLFIFLSVTVCGFGAAPLSETPPTPKDVARSAVEAYNQQTSTDVVFRFLQLRTVRRKNFDWGVHFSINFTIKETDCRKPVVYDVQVCKYGSKGKIRDCFAEATVLDFMDDAPLTSVECHEPQMPKPKKPASPKRKKQKAKRQPQVMAEDAEVKVQYFINSYSTAGLTLAGAGTDE
ncbi:protegrin-2-like isoform X1 [Lissotriton helveticus]